MIKRIHSNFASSRFDRNELSGSLGDMGTFIPLTAALIAINGIQAGSVLFFAGLFNITAGLVFGIPICVQPMKAIAAIAIAGKLTPDVIYGAGIFVGAFFLIISASGLLEKIEKLIPLSVVRGLQMGIGLNLMIKGFSFIVGTGSFTGADSILTGLLGAALVLVFFFSKRFPSALVLFTLGVVLTVLLNPPVRANLSLELSLPSLNIVSKGNIINGMFKAGLAQIPLTLLNSIIAVCALSEKLFPRMPAENRATGLSIGLMNVIGPFFGAMPMCHGAGGLAGQYRFGARTAGSMLILGFGKLLLGLFAASAVTSIMLYYPKSILGVLLIVSGMELAILVRDQGERTLMFIALLTAAAILAVGTLAGFLLGLSCAYAVARGLIKIEKSFERKRIIGVYNNEKTSD